MGAGINKTVLKKLNSLFKKNRAEKKREDDHQKDVAAKIECVQNDLATKFGQVQEQISRLTQSLEERSGGTAVYQENSETSLTSGCHIDARVVAIGGWPFRDLALGIVIVVDPTHRISDRAVGEGNYRIYIDIVLSMESLLPEPHNQWTTIGDIGQGHVIWPKNCLKFLSS